jgi:hypothetical protein
VDTLRRRWLLDPALFAIVLPALHAVDATWMAFLDGLATGAHRPVLCVLAEPTVHPRLDGPNWLAGALTLAYPAATGQGQPSARARQRLVVVLLPQIAATALDHAWATPIHTVALPDDEEPPEWVFGLIASELARLPTTAAAEQLASVVDEVLGSVDVHRTGPD